MPNFVTVATVDEVPPGELKQIKREDVRLVLANVEGRIYAFGWECNHTSGGPLYDGWLEGLEIECPWHGGRYDITTGEATSFPACDVIPVYEVQVEDGEIKVGLP